MIQKNDLTKNQEVYYCKIMPKLDIYDILDLKIRTITDTYFVGLEKIDKSAHLFKYNETDNLVFLNRSEALEFIKDEELKYKEDD